MSEEEIRDDQRVWDAVFTDALGSMATAACAEAINSSVDGRKVVARVMFASLWADGAVNARRESIKKRSAQ